MALYIAWRQFVSHWAAGEVRVLLLALMLAVAATTSVGFFTDRVESALVRQGGLLLGGDLVVTSKKALPDEYRRQAAERGLKTASSIEFPSMVVRDERSQLAEIKAVSEGFPLRGELTIAAGLTDQGRPAAAIPAVGTVWLEPRLANLLGLGVGDALEVGERKFVVSAILQREPSRGGDMFSIAPRLLMNQADVAATGLIQFGSRAEYELLVAADAAAVQSYADWAKQRLMPGERVQDVSSARPEMRSALEKSRQFLGLSAMVSVILAMVAMFLASLPYVQKSLDTYALMRCFGASKSFITQILLCETLLLAVIGSVLGCLLGFAAQAGLAALAGSLFLEQLPAPGFTPALVGMLAGCAALLAVVWPHLLRLRNVPALLILRRELGTAKHGRAASSMAEWLSFLPALLVMVAMVFWQAHDVRLASYTLVAFAGLLLLIMLLAATAAGLLQRLPQVSSGAWKLGLAALKRRPTMALAQITGFSLGLMALILLALVRNDLLDNWQASLPVDAPNRFLINIQQNQIAGVEKFFAEAGLANADVYPMVRGKLVAINQQPLDPEKYEDEHAQRLASREFNLSWAAHMQQDNQIVAGRWWDDSEHGTLQMSLEQGLAETLGIKLGDRLGYDIAGTQLTFKVTSLRKVEWDTMRANFFAVVPPGVLEPFSASFITSFHLPLGKDEPMNGLIRNFPNLTLIDLAELMEQVRGIMGRMTSAIEYVFLFSILAGLAVLYAALVATREERVHEATLLRVLGASRRQVALAVIAEFFCIGLLAATVASVAATALAYYISIEVLGIGYRFNFALALLAILLSSVLVPFAAWIGLRRFLNQPPRALLQSI